MNTATAPCPSASRASAANVQLPRRKTTAAPATAEGSANHGSVPTELQPPLKGVAGTTEDHGLLLVLGTAACGAVDEPSQMLQNFWLVVSRIAFISATGGEEAAIFEQHRSTTTHKVR